MSPLFSPLHFTSPRFLCLLSFSFLLLSVFFLVSLCCGRCASQAVSNVSQAHHIFMCSCLFLSSALPFSIFSVSLSPCACSLPLSILSLVPSLLLQSSVQLEKEREWERERKKEKERKSEWNNGERRGKFRRSETFSSSKTEKTSQVRPFVRRKSHLFSVSVPFISFPLFFLSGGSGPLALTGVSCCRKWRDHFYPSLSLLLSLSELDFSLNSYPAKRAQR